MTRLLSRRIASTRLLAAFVPCLLILGSNALAQCPSTELVSGLRMPLGITRSPQGNLIVGEAGTSAPNTVSSPLAASRTGTKIRCKIARSIIELDFDQNFNGFR